MAGFNDILTELQSEGVGIIGASSDDLEHGREVQQKLGFPIAYGVTQTQAGTIGAWWENNRQFVQPSEFVLDGDGNVVSATYSTGPIGRVMADDALKLVQFYKKREAKG